MIITGIHRWKHWQGCDSKITSLYQNFSRGSSTTDGSDTFQIDVEYSESANLVLFRFKPIKISVHLMWVDSVNVAWATIKEEKIQ